MPTQTFKIAVTGGAGLVGCAVVQQALSDGHTIVAIDLPPTGKISAQERYTYTSVDLTDFHAFLAAVKGCDALVHLAALYNRPNQKIPEHIVHNKNTAMSYNALCVAAELNIDRVVLASSINSIGMLYSEHPHFDYLPVDEKHPFYPEDAYSLSKYFVELQSDSFARKYPSMRIATLRFHFVVSPETLSRESLHANGPGWKDLWGWVSAKSTARSCLLALTVPEERFPRGHETFFIVAPTTSQQSSTMELVKGRYPELTDFRREIKGNMGLFNCAKAERMLGWTEQGFEWMPDGKGGVTSG